MDTRKTTSDKEPISNIPLISSSSLPSSNGVPIPDFFPSSSLLAVDGDPIPEDITSSTCSLQRRHHHDTASTSPVLPDRISSVFVNKTTSPITSSSINNTKVSSFSEYISSVTNNSPSGLWVQRCEQCNYDPCIIFMVYNIMQEYANHQYSNGKTNCEIRSLLYCRMSSHNNGTLGIGNTKELPQCVVKCIQNSYPNKNPQQPYIGFKQS